MENNTLHFTSLAQALVSLYGEEIKILQTDRLSGGDINKSYGLTLSNKKHIFMKANSKDNVSFFKAESLSINAIKKTNTINTPNILCTGTDNGEDIGYSFLLMEYIENNPSNKNSAFWETFAYKLAQMHKADTESFVPKGKFGFLEDNFIGYTKQINTPTHTWIDFFRDNRLIPQFKLAEKYFDDFMQKKISKLLDKLDKILVEPEKPSLLHGDLWSGNIIADSNFNPYLIDPAAYVGNLEAEIAMTELFGGFDKIFYDIYKRENLLTPEYEERRDLYNLYHLLNHLNMFGKTYFEPVQSIISEYVD